jgi:molybdopterin-containing oxidoreductase family iron-sulfur binding subunit
MSKLDQCPSTKNEERTPEGAAHAKRVTGRAYWRSLDEWSQTQAFRDFVEREFPAGASELAVESRRDFVKLMGAGLALAGAATLPGCRRPEHHILPYSKDVPEQVIPGKALYYATAMPLPGGGAEGVLAETHAGRPTKIEGNPLHPVNRGKSSIWAQASVLTLYDPDRLKHPVYLNPATGPKAATWDDFKAWGKTHLEGFDATRGRGLAFLVDKKTSPTRNALKSRLMRRWPEASWHAYSASERSGAADGARAAFGAPARVHYNLSEAKRILSLDSDFVVDGPEALIHARDLGASRRVRHAGDEMSRLYVLESCPSATGSMADHRLRMAPSQISAFALALANAVGAGRYSVPEGSGVDQEVVAQIAEDLLANKGHSVVIPGPSQPAAVHALCHAINSALGAMGSVVTTTPMSADEARSSVDSIRELTEAMRAGTVETLVCIDTNPLFDAPADLNFADAFATIPTTITWSVQASETAARSTWSLNGAHFLESWGDVEAYDGTISPIQPMIAPLYDPALSDIELLAFFAGDENPDGYGLVRQTWAAMLGSSVENAAFDKRWRRALHDGLLAGTNAERATPNANLAGVRAAVGGLSLGSAPTPEALEVVFSTGNIGDGRWANCGWLQELPDTASKVVWDNPAYVSPATAKQLGLLPEHSWQDEYNPYTKSQMPQAQMATLTLGGRQLELPVWILPGLPDNTVVLRLGYGRTDAGHVGDQVGFNTYALRTSDSPATAGGATLAKASGAYTIASTQNHWTMGGRDTILRSLDKKWWDKHGDAPPLVAKDHIYGGEGQPLHLAEKMGELAHTPRNVSIYANPLNESQESPAPGSPYSKGPQWGMTIDTGACSGCGVCTIACQSENSIPIVGKREVAKGREMQWIRVDRYFGGDDLNNPTSMMNQPVACVHCENAPCETVCPVNATVHGAEGTNDMAYNRCIGTRYCANNCPYKVRRFNFFEWGWNKYNGRFYGEDLIGDGQVSQKELNKNLIPPRLRQKLDEIQRMQLNPDVTVRSRGVMEKCTYCIQRVNEARQEVKVKNIWKRGQVTEMGPDYEAPIPDGFFQVACQQACPTDAIVFGDILDPNSRVSQWRNNQRSYMVLGYLNTRPRTHHLMRVDNPNEALLAHLDPEGYEARIAHDPLDHGGGHGEHGGDGHDEGHGGEPGGEHTETHGFFYDTNRSDDRGYALSLRVLGAATGVHA